MCCAKIGFYTRRVARVLDFIPHSRALYEMLMSLFMQSFGFIWFCGLLITFVALHGLRGGADTPRFIDCPRLETPHTRNAMLYCSSEPEFVALEAKNYKS